MADIVDVDYLLVFPAKQASSALDVAAMIGHNLYWRPCPPLYLDQGLIDGFSRTASQDLHGQDVDIVMVETIAVAAILGQGDAKDDQALVSSQLDGQIKQIGPIRAGRQRPPQQEQANTQQPQTDGFRTGAKGDS